MNDVYTPGRLLSDTRARAGLTVEELAERCGVSADTLAAAEGDRVDVSAATFFHWLAATGLPPAFVHPRGAGRDLTDEDLAELHRSVMTLIAAVDFPPAMPDGFHGRAPGGALGLVAVCMEALTDLAVLSQLDHGGVSCHAITRLIFEHAARATWLLDAHDVADERYMLFAQDSNRYLRLLAQEDSEADWTARLTEKQLQFLQAFPEQDRFDRRLRIEDTLVSPMEEWYPRYRWLSLRTHPSLATAEACYDWQTQEAVVPATESVLLGFASMLTWAAVVTSHLELGWPSINMPRDDYVALGSILNRYARGDAILTSPMHPTHDEPDGATG